MTSYITSTPRVAPQYGISSAEVERRQAAFDRLLISTSITATVFAADLIVDYFPLSVLGILVLALAMLGSRVALRSFFGRFAETTWTISDSTLKRTDGRSDDEYQLASIRRVRTLRTTRGDIREMQLAFEGNESLHVNGLEDFEGFLAALASKTPTATAEEAAEPIDFDHPFFYVVFGAAVGLTIALALRLLLLAPDLDPRYLYAALSVYSLALAAYWLWAKPMSSRYGERGIAWDRVFALGVGCLGVGAGLIALFV